MPTKEKEEKREKKSRQEKKEGRKIIQQRDRKKKSLLARVPFKKTKGKKKQILPLYFFAIK